MIRILWLVCCLGVIVKHNESARILGVFPTPSVSHQIVFKTLFYELAKRGHEVVLVTPNPGLPKDRAKDNITEIDTSDTYEILKELRKSSPAKRGMVMDLDVMFKHRLNAFFQIVQMTMRKPEVRTLYEDKNNKFDLIIVESLYYTPLGLGKVFNAPVIWFSSLYGSTENYDRIGAPARHPILYPNFYRNRINNLSVWDKLSQIYDEYRLHKGEQAKNELELQLARELFEDGTLTLDELSSLVDLFFVNVNRLFDGNRPVSPNVIYIGALHLQSPKKLPQDLKSTLDNSRRGVVYVSFGTNVMPSLMDSELLETFLKAFEKLPYDVLWKFDGDKLPWLPKNVQIQKWFPQRDLLLHPKIKAFVTQGGLQSMDEAIDAGVPLVAIPALGDQWYNAEKFEQFGIGIKLDFLKLEASHIVDAVNKVIKDKSYKANLKGLRVAMTDIKKTPLETAVWWTEYVLRHKGAKHLGPLPTSWSEFFILDVVLTSAVAVLVVMLTIVLVLKKCFRLLFKKQPPTPEAKKEN